MLQPAAGDDPLQRGAPVEIVGSGSVVRRDEVAEGLRGVLDGRQVDPADTVGRVSGLDQGRCEFQLDRERLQLQGGRAQVQRERRGREDAGVDQAHGTRSAEEDVRAAVLVR